MPRRIRPLHEWAETFERYWTHQLNRIKERAEAKMRVCATKTKPQSETNEEKQ